MNAERSGFTLVEVAVVIMIGAILTSMAVRNFGGATDRFAVRQARESFLSLHARARAHAVERGVTSRLNVAPNGDSVWITAGGTRVEFRNFASTMEIDIDTNPAGGVRLCMNSRGFADTGCNNFGGSAEVEFSRGDAAEAVRILALGQVQW